MDFVIALAAWLLLFFLVILVSFIGGYEFALWYHQSAWCVQNAS